ncbi:bacillithiol system redox-active protein YtxJ [Priestia abyssalis]|uniref:bacillithiol system redox-active protein YtxJ n=1 Tax=Priestia abyssalis TaxID=1221450 RepID=UPI000995427A|nr:bacillithiol system redox-active protein YtxJ [Priestia abyssalis]
MEKIMTVEQFDKILQEKNHFLFLKHSITCPISKAGYDEFAKFAGEHPDIDSYFLHVQEARALSNYIAERFDIKHESPQAFIIKNQEVVWNASHWNITSKAMNEHS